MLQFFQFEFELAALERMTLPPFPGPVLRGGILSSLKEVVCTTGMDDCNSCPLVRECVFARVALPSRADTDTDSYFTSQIELPRPFVLSGVETPSQIKPESTIRFTLGLAGTTARFAAHLITACRILGERGLGRARRKFRLQSVASVDPLCRAPDSLVYSCDDDECQTGERIHAVSLEDVVNRWQYREAEQIRVEFLTPTQIQSAGNSPKTPPEFAQFLKAVLRRYSNLAALYSGERPKLDYKEMIARADNVKVKHWQLTTHRSAVYSSRKSASTPVRGLTGEVVYAGEIGQSMPHVLFGQWLHVGKQATFGMGEYRVSCDLP